MSKTLNYFVKYYTNLPDFTFELHGIYLPFERNKDVEIIALNGIRKQYRALGLWMEFYLLNNMDCLPELRFTDKGDYKPLANVSLAYYRLAQEVFLLSPEFVENFKTPVHLWFLVEWEKCELLLEKLVWGEPKRPMSKRKHYEKIVEIMNVDPAHQNLLPEKIIYSPLYLLINEAMLLAHDKNNFEFRNKYRAFTRILKRNERLIMESPLVPHYIKDGKLRPIRTD